ncbi:MAG: hypothetical protein ABW168_13935, partial [Sedimenticola sp.]
GMESGKLGQSVLDLLTLNETFSKGHISFLTASTYTKLGMYVDTSLAGWVFCPGCLAFAFVISKPR